MRFRYTLILVALAAFCFTSCNDDVELFGEIKELPVVYGLLSSTDSAQYVRVERTFADPNTGAVVLAQDENEVYYNDVTVQLVNMDDNITTMLTRVNAVDDGYVRKEGDFLTDPNYLYKVNSDEIDLTPGKNYSLQVIKNDIQIAEAQTTVLDESRFSAPTVSAGIAKISFVNGKTTRIRWRRVPNASYYAISFDVTILERNTSSGEQELVEFRWDATNLISDDGGSNQSQDEELDGQSFFNAFQENLDPKPNVSRQLLKLDIRISSFGEAVGQYLDVINANTGITSAQEVPTFTNITGGLGLYSSTTETILEDLAPSVVTFDSLYDGRVTSDLNFTP